MTKEEKELLLKDLCIRLPYRVIVNVQYKDRDGWKTEDRKLEGIYDDGQIYVNCVYTNIENIKPYLRQMESMTKDEIEDYHNLCTKQWNVHMDDYWYYDTPESIDWLNAHHFDYRGLIEKGLAIKASKEMYK